MALRLSAKQLVSIILSTYRSEPCRICGELIANDRDPVFAGYAVGGARAAHRDCWDNRPDKKQWAYPVDKVKS